MRTRRRTTTSRNDRLPPDRHSWSTVSRSDSWSRTGSGRRRRSRSSRPPRRRCAPVVAVDEGAERRELADDVRLVGQPLHAVAPGGASGGRQILQHAGMLQDEGDLGKVGGELCGVLHLRWRTPAGRTTSRSRRAARDSCGSAGSFIRSGRGAKRYMLVLVPVQLHADAAHQRKGRLPRQRLGRHRRPSRSA